VCVKLYCKKYRSTSNVVVEAVCYKSEGRGFKTRRGELNFSIYLILPAALGPGVYPASNKNKVSRE
jgi:hypothetical protein